MTEAKPLVLSAAQNFFAGWIAAGVARTVASPFENIRVQLQCSDDDNATILSTMQTMYAADGFAAFFKGNLTGIVRVPFYSYSQWLSIQFLSSLYQSQFGDPTAFWNWLLIVSGGEIATIITAPFDAVKTRLQFAQAVKWSDYDCPLCFIRASIRQALATVAALVRAEGWGGLFAGLAPALMAHFPQAAIRWTAQTFLPRVLHLEGQKGHPLFALALGCTSLAVAETVVLPLDTVRRRNQRGDAKGKSTKGSVGKILRQIQTQKGTLGLWSGASANILRIVPYNATLVATYDWLSWWMTR